MSSARTPLYLIVAAFAVLALAAPAGAATIKVTSLEDKVDANLGDPACATSAGACTLRAAVQTANALAGPDIVVLPAGIYSLTEGFAKEDAAAGGDLDVVGELAIVGAGAATTTIDGRGFDRVLQVHGGASATLSGVTLKNGRATDGFGGGGILNGGSVNLTNVALVGNNSTTGGGGLQNGGSATLVNVTLSGNAAASHGAGLWNFNGQVSLTNVTISGNRAGSTGGAVRNDGPGAVVTLVSVTVAGNSSNFINAALVNEGGAGGITIRSTILSGAPGESCYGAIASAGFNIDNGGSCKLAGAGDKPGTDPLLGPLGTNGGQVETHSLLPGSPALEAGDPGACPPTDARAVPRPQGAGCDIGAFEHTPPRSFKRTVTLALSEHLVARGTVRAPSAAPASCLAVRVRIQRKAGAGWRNAGSAVASETGEYRVQLRDRDGTYRALVTPASAGEDTCLDATSRTKRHRHK